jgi:hypothetical protein
MERQKVPKRTSVGDWISSLSNLLSLRQIEKFQEIFSIGLEKGKARLIIGIRSNSDRNKFKRKFIMFVSIQNNNQNQNQALEGLGRLVIV